MKIITIVQFIFMIWIFNYYNFNKDSICRAWVIFATFQKYIYIYILFDNTYSNGKIIGVQWNKIKNMESKKIF